VELERRQLRISSECLHFFFFCRFTRGLYGNTMTTNPRALDIGSAVLDEMNNDVRANIQRVGGYLQSKLNFLAEKHRLVTHSTGKCF
jgi:4-aminobutyrate aminotransferase-like enzyme